MSNRISFDNITSPLFFISAEKFVTKTCPKCNTIASSHAILCGNCTVPLSITVDKAGFDNALRNSLLRAMQNTLHINDKGLFDRAFKGEPLLIQHTVSSICIMLVDIAIKLDIPRFAKQISDLERAPSTGDSVRSVDLSGALRHFKEDLVGSLQSLQAIITPNPIEKYLTAYQEHYNLYRKLSYQIGLAGEKGTVTQAKADNLQQVETQIRHELDLINNANNALAGQAEIREEWGQFMKQLEKIPAEKLTPDLYVAAAEWSATLRVLRNLLSFTKKFGSFTQTKKKGA